MKLGIIRCMQTEDYCPGTADFCAVTQRTGAFSEIGEEIELVGFINCGGCHKEEQMTACIATIILLINASFAFAVISKENKKCK